MTSPAAPPAGNWFARHKVLTAVIAFLGVTMLIGGIASAVGSGDTEETAVEAPAAVEPVVEPEPVEAPEPSPAAPPVEPAPPVEVEPPAEPEASDEDRVREAASGLDDANVSQILDEYVVTFRIKDGFNEGMIRGGIALDTFDFLERLRESGVEFSRVVLNGEFEVGLTDGSTQVRPVYQAIFTADAVDGIDFDSVDRTELDNLRPLTDEDLVLEEPLAD